MFDKKTIDDLDKQYFRAVFVDFVPASCSFDEQVNNTRDL
jgi:hypothetical protein